MRNLMNLKHVFILITLQIIVLCSQKTQAQTADKIYKIDNSVLSVKIVDITADTINYKAFWKGSQPIFQIPRAEVSRISFTDAFGATYDIVGDKAVKRPAPHIKAESADKIYKKDNTVLSVGIVKIVGDTIWCQAYWTKESQIFYILKTDVEAIAFKTGTTNYYTQQAVDKLIATIRQKKQFSNGGASIPDQRNVGFSYNLGGPSLFGSLNFDLFLSRNFSLEFGAPLQIATKGVYGGAKLHFPMTSKTNKFLSFYIGCIISAFAIPDTDNGVFAYFPIGIHSTNQKGFIFSIEAALINGDFEQVLPWAQIRFGKRFLRNTPVKK